MPVTFVWDIGCNWRRKFYIDTEWIVSSDAFPLFFGISQIGLEGEHLGIYKADGLSSVKWISSSEPSKEQPLTWYKVDT